jgi:15-cis-phytoene synthase
VSEPVSQGITRRSASNLALAFVLLPRARREAMSALYAFCREVDDVADSDDEPVERRRERLAAWRADIAVACNQGTPEFAVNRELQPHMARYGLSFEHFDEIIRGVEMDLDIHRYLNYEALEQYCYRVASAVGLLSIEIFGYHNPACREYAVVLGKALQFTNILRDVGTDAARGRIYLPLEGLNRFHVTEEEILSGDHSPRFVSLAHDFAGRAREFYRRAGAALPPEDRRSMIAAEVMGSVYWCLLKQVRAGGYQVLGDRVVRLGRWQKLFLIWRTWCRIAVAPGVRNYGTP